MTKTVRLALFAFSATTLSTFGGCAALSLFGQTHTHHHHHNYDCDSSDVATRLESLERRLAKMERPGGSDVQFSSHSSAE